MSCRKVDRFIVMWKRHKNKFSITHVLVILNILCFLIIISMLIFGDSILRIEMLDIKSVYKDANGIIARGETINVDYVQHIGDDTYSIGVVTDDGKVEWHTVKVSNTYFLNITRKPFLYRPKNTKEDVYYELFLPENR